MRAPCQAPPEGLAVGLAGCAERARGSHEEGSGAGWCPREPSKTEEGPAWRREQLGQRPADGKLGMAGAQNGGWRQAKAGKAWNVGAR